MPYNESADGVLESPREENSAPPPRDLPAIELLGATRVSTYPEARWIQSYLTSSNQSRQPLILLSIGESWQGPPQALVQALGAAPAWTHGYQMTPWGSSKLQQVVRKSFASEGYLSDIHLQQVEVGMVSTGTRSVMFDFARWLKASRPGHWSAVLPSLGWEYEEVVSGASFAIMRVPLNAAAGFQPDLSRFENAIDTAAAQGNVLVVVNAQHNPTGVNWRPDQVRDLLAMARDKRCALLIDDAHYAMCDDGVTPTPALKLWLQADGPRARIDPPWLATRSLGKEFGCNGWGVGACIAPLDTLLSMGRLRGQHLLGIGAAWQYAMASWLSDGEAVAAWRSNRRRIQAEARRQLSERLIQMGWQASDIVGSDCTPFAMIRVPPAFRQLEHPALAYCRWCIEHAGIVVSPQQVRTGQANEYVRVFLGGQARSLQQALRRLAALNACGAQPAMGEQAQ